MRIIHQNVVQSVFDFDILNTMPPKQSVVTTPTTKDTPQKQCTACLKQLPATPYCFYRQRLGIYGLQSVCKQCQKAGIPPIKTHVPDGHRRCYACHQILPHESFSKDRSDHVHGLQRRCRACCAEYSKNRTPEKVHKKHLRGKYNITLEQYHLMLANQGGVCAVCGDAETYRDPRTQQPVNLSVDHDHKTGKVRALLCRRCNAAYGNLKEDPERVKALLRYAEYWQVHQ